MANALLLGQASRLGDAQGVGVLADARAQGQNMAAQRQQMGQNNALFQQQQQDRQRQMAEQEKERQMQPLREDYARFMQLPDDNARTQAWQGGLAQHYGQDPNSDWKPVLAQVTQQPGFLPPELTAKIMEQHFAPKQQEPFTLNAGDRRYGADGKMIASAPAKPDATQSRLVPMPDPNSPTGYSYGVPAPGESAAPPRNAASSRLPPSIQQAEDGDIEAIQLATAIGKDLGALNKQLDQGTLALGPVTNLTSRAKNFAGVSDEVSRNFATFKSTLEKLRNDSLRLNKGVQTEGDAQRAWDEILSNMNDVEYVKQRLAEVQEINNRAALFRDQQIQNRRQSYGREALDTEQFRAPYAAIGGSGQIKEGTTATNPKTGEKIMLRGGQWVPAQ